jgi:CPA1 family monovalent cation:H+ antiporter
MLQGEALFNDGVGIVIFTALLAFAAGRAPTRCMRSARVRRGAGRPAARGRRQLCRLRAMRARRRLCGGGHLSVALAMGAYAGAQALHLSGPIAVVGAGLLIGDRKARGETSVQSAETEAHLQTFWTLVDEILNALCSSCSASSCCWCCRSRPGCSLERSRPSCSWSSAASWSSCRGARTCACVTRSAART